MFAIEFQTEIIDGTIELPEAYRAHFSGPVRVIILADEQPVEEDIIDHLLTNSIPIEQFTPLQRDQIYE